uniref:Uncharacterized protein n=1 Tax=Magallana gigas TaxID=29159 RepID=K1RUT2_MAGGI
MENVLVDYTHLKGWFHEDDVFIVDIGFRDSVEMLEELGILAEMPRLISKGQKQMTTLDANAFCLVTKWEVATDSLEFPNIGKDHIRNLTCGVYQLKLCPSYIQEYLEGVWISWFTVSSMGLSGSSYRAVIKFSESEITAWYCRCRAVARVVRVCSHVAAVIWFLTVGRRNREAISTIQDWSEFVTDASVIDGSEDSDDSEEEE